MPGCGQLYMGFMKRGLSMLLLFAVAVFVASILNMGELAMLIIVIWFYAFFDAINLGWLDPERFAQIEDSYLCFDDDALKNIFKTRNGFTKYAGIGLVVFGAAVLWENTVSRIIDVVYDYNIFAYEMLWTVNRMLPRIAVSILVIVLGIKMIKAKKEEVREEIALDVVPSEEDKENE